MHFAHADILLPARGPFDLRATVLSHRYHELPAWQWIDAATPVLRRAERLPDGSVHLLAVTPARGGVRLRVTGPDADEVEVLAPLASRTRRALQLDLDLTPFHRLCRHDPALRPIARLGLGRLLRGTTLFEDVVNVITWTNTSWSSTVRMMRALTQLGTPCPAEPRLRAFPSPRDLARARPGTLRAAVGARGTQLLALARGAASGRCDLEALDAAASTMSADELRTALRRVRGIGPASLAWLLLLLGKFEPSAICRPAARHAASPPARLAQAAAYGGPAPVTAWQELLRWCAQRLAEPGAVTELSQRLRRKRPSRARQALRRSSRRTARTRPRAH